MASGVTTQWDDMQVKMGNWTPHELQPTNDEVFNAHVEQAELYDEFKNKKLETLDRMLEDDMDLEEDEYFKEYRQKRLEELKVNS